MVDFPDPFEPSSAVISPGFTVRDAPLRATTASNDFSILRISNKFRHLQVPIFYMYNFTRGGLSPLSAPLFL
jgi:hypothetical protein